MKKLYNRSQSLRNVLKLDEQMIERFWSKYSVNDNTIALTHVKKFLSVFSDVDFQTTVMDALPHIDMSSVITLEEFRLLVFTFCRKSSLHVSVSMIHPPVVTKTRQLMSKFKDYVDMPFIEETHNSLLCRLWQKAFPVSEIPKIPSKRWQQLGFQGSNPATDFRGSGLCGIHCLLALANHSDMFLYLMTSSEIHHIPFATAGINVVMLIYEFLGWGFKSPRVPSGRSPQTYSRLCSLLFCNLNHLEEEQEAFENCKITFYKMYFLVFVLLAESWESTHSSYFDFPRMLDITSNRFEATIEKIDTVDALDRYLFGTLLLDISVVNNEEALRIYMPNHLTRSIKLNPDKDQKSEEVPTLYRFLNNLGYRTVPNNQQQPHSESESESELQSQSQPPTQPQLQPQRHRSLRGSSERRHDLEYVVYDYSGQIIDTTTVLIEDIVLKSIYLYPKGNIPSPFRRCNPPLPQTRKNTPQKRASLLDLKTTTPQIEVEEQSKIPTEEHIKTNPPPPPSSRTRGESAIQSPTLRKCLTAVRQHEGKEKPFMNPISTNTNNTPTTTITTTTTIRRRQSRSRPITLTSTLSSPNLRLEEEKENIPLRYSASSSSVPKLDIPFEHTPSRGRGDHTTLKITRIPTNRRHKLRGDGRSVSLKLLQPTTTTSTHTIKKY